MNSFKCKDYFIIKHRCYADARLLKKWEGKPGLPKQHSERARDHNNYLWELISFITKKTQDDWFYEYIFDTRECAFEELEEKYGIFFSGGEGWSTLMIPKKHDEIIEWIKTNKTKVPSKVVSKLKYIPFYLVHKEKDLNFKRKTSLESTIKFKNKYPQFKK